MRRRGPVCRVVLSCALSLAAAAALAAAPGPGVSIVRVSPLLMNDDFDALPTPGDRLDPADEAALARALTLVRMGRAGDGLGELRRLGARYPQSPRVGSAMAATLLALGKRTEAIPWMVASGAEAGVRSARLRAQLVEWAATADLGPRVVEAAERRGDAEPESADLALLVAEIECRAAHPERAWPRLRRAEAADRGLRRGEFVRVLAERLAAESATAPQWSAWAWLELARGAGYDEGLRGDALERLIATRPDWRAADRPPGASIPTAELEEAWRGLPPGAARARLGLELIAFFRGRGEEAAIRRVLTALGGESAPPELAADLDLEAGLAAVRDGDLVAARQRLARARDGAAGPEVRERAEYGLAEARFYSGEFDSALAGFDAFAAAYPQSGLANDALERAFLLETGAESGAPAGGAPGLEALSRGLWAEARQRWAEAALLARQAEAEARAAHPEGATTGLFPDTVQAASDPVRAHALLLLSRVEERRSDLPAALAAVLAVADSLAGDRQAPLACARAGDLLLAQGRADQALARYEETLVRYPRAWLAAEVRRKADALRARNNP